MRRSGYHTNTHVVYALFADCTVASVLHDASYRAARAQTPFCAVEVVLVQDDGAIRQLRTHASRSETTIHRGASQI